VRNPTTWFQLGIIGDAGPEISNGLGAFLYAGWYHPRGLRLARRSMHERRPAKPRHGGLDDAHHPPVPLPPRKGPARVLHRQRIEKSQVFVGPQVDYPTPDQKLLVGVVEIDDRHSHLTCPVSSDQELVQSCLSLTKV